MTTQHVAQLGRTVERRAIRKLCRRVDPGAGGVDVSPLADRVEILERQPQFVHLRMAAGAHRIRAVLRHLLAHRQHLRRVPLFLQLGHVCRRRRRCRAENVFQDPLAADHRRGPVRTRRPGQNRALSQQPAAHAVAGKRNLPEALAIDAGNAVVLRQPLVQERVVRVEQIEDAAILPDDAVEEQLGLAAEGLPQVVVKVEEQLGAGPEPVNVADLQPLAGEVAHQRLRPWIREHPLHLAIKSRRFMQRVLLGRIQQLVIRDAAPQEE